MGALQLELLSTQVRCDQDSGHSTDGNNRYVFDHRFACVSASANPTSDSVHQTGMGYSSNNAGDGPEKTRDRKSWFPRFKSNWLGTFRSKQMFQCCECAVVSASNNSSLSTQAGRYKGAEGKHCRCGKDQWHLAKSVEETEYNRRMEISKALGGMRYDEAVLRLRSMGQSELDFKPFEQAVSTESPIQPRSTQGFAPSSSSASSSSLLSSSSSSNPPKRTRSMSKGPLVTPTSRSFVAPQPTKPELSALPTMSSQIYNYEKQYGVYNPVYGNNGIEYAQPAQPHHLGEYEQLTPASFGDEEGFGELLQGILEDDPRVASGANMGLNPNSYRYACYTGAPSHSSVAPLKRTMSMPSHAMTMSMMTSPPREGVEQEYYADANRRSSLNLGADQAPSYIPYHPVPQQQPQQQQFPYHEQPQQQTYSRPLSMTLGMATTTSSSFSA